MSDKIRILIADDHLYVRLGVAAVIEDEPDFELVGQAVNGVEAVEKTFSLHPDVVLMDLVMPNKDGLEAISDICARDPNVRILVLTSFAEDDKVYRAVQSGALGYLLKDSSAEELAKAIRGVSNGDLVLPPPLARKLINELKQPPKLPPTQEPLTEREEEVLRLLAQGLTNKEIATQLTVSEHTVHNHVGNILRKLQLANRTQAALYALKERS